MLIAPGLSRPASAPALFFPDHWEALYHQRVTWDHGPNSPAAYLAIGDRRHMEEVWFRVWGNGSNFAGLGLS